MKPVAVAPAAWAQPSDCELTLSGCWTAFNISAIAWPLPLLQIAAATRVTADASGIQALDSADAWLLQGLLLHLRGEGVAVEVRGLRR